MKRLCLILFALGLAFMQPALACTSGEIDVAGDGTNCQTAKFTITTTELEAETEFNFLMSAQGTFYIDCGAGGTLSGTGVSGKIATRTNTTVDTYTCAYSSAGVKTIRFSGLATAYSTAGFYSHGGAIQFNCYQCAQQSTLGYKLIAAIDGSLGAIFPTLGSELSQQPMFGNTFSGVPATSIPENLFSGIYGCRGQMFMQTFFNSKITSIPNKLFSGMTCPAYAMFQNTFFGTKITSIPPDLFENMVYGDDTGVMKDMFFYLFRDCTDLTGYIPPSLFAGLNNSGLYGQNMMAHIFYNTGLDTACPPGTEQFITGYEDYWAGHVSCKAVSVSCDAGQYLPMLYNDCAKCPENNYCSGGTYTFNETAAQGITACAAGLYSPTGMSSADQCGHILHIGNEVVYLHSVKKTSPSLHAKLGDDIFYGNMTTADVPMHAGSERKLKVTFNGTIYSIYDDTVQVSE